MNYELTRTLLLGGIALGQTAFVLLYFLFPWLKTFLGRALFFKALAFATLVDVFIAARIFPILRDDRIFTALYALLFVGVWAQFFAFLKVWREGREAEA